MIYNWQQSDWPDFSYELQKVEDLLIAITESLGQVSGMLHDCQKIYFLHECIQSNRHTGFTGFNSIRSHRLLQAEKVRIIY